jgi:hypothetical protein
MDIRGRIPLFLRRVRGFIQMTGCHTPTFIFGVMRQN